MYEINLLMGAASLTTSEILYILTYVQENSWHLYHKINLCTKVLVLWHLSGIHSPSWESHSNSLRYKISTSYRPWDSTAVFAKDTDSSTIIWHNDRLVVHSHPAISPPTFNCVAYKLRSAIGLTSPYGNVQTLTQHSTDFPPTCIIQSAQLNAEPDHDIPVHTWVADRLYTQFRNAQNSTSAVPIWTYLLLKSGTCTCVWVMPCPVETSGNFDDKLLIYRNTLRWWLWLTLIT
jgi:hypothetical protein